MPQMRCSPLAAGIRISWPEKITVISLSAGILSWHSRRRSGTTRRGVAARRRRSWTSRSRRTACCSRRTCSSSRTWIGMTHTTATQTGGGTYCASIQPSVRPPSLSHSPAPWPQADREAGAAVGAQPGAPAAQQWVQGVAQLRPDRGQSLDGPTRLAAGAVPESGPEDDQDGEPLRGETRTKPKPVTEAGFCSTVTHKIKAVFLKFRKIWITVCTCFHWIVWSTQAVILVEARL